jgi:dTDP-glucose pyrophosphorylase
VKALVLARGLGTRMQRADAGAALTDAQVRAADAGLKPLMPIAGRPFLDYVLASLADAGLVRVGLVVAPEHGAIAAYYAAHPPARVALNFVVQPEPRGTADAVRAAESWTEGHPFLVLNGDNLYPVRALRDLVSLDEPGLPAFDADDLVRSSNIPEDRIRAFALIDVDEAGYLTGIVEKPADAIPAATDARPPEGGRDASRANDPVVSAFRRKTLVSMNLWRFDARIFAPCRDVAPSARGEYELPGAVDLAVRRGVRFRAIAAVGPVLDLSRRGDAADVERRLAGAEPRP